MTMKAFENAITVIITLGGSTNAVLHLIAMADAAGVDLNIDDFTRIGANVPVIADLKPSGKYLMSELIEIGGTLPLMKMLLDAGMLHGDCMTVTGKTMAENLADVKPYDDSQDIIRSLDNPIKKDSHLRILRGNLAVDGAVAKITGKEGLSFKGVAKCYGREEEALAAVLNDEIKAGDVIVIRYEGPAGGPGMREMLAPTSAVMGKGVVTACFTKCQFQDHVTVAAIKPINNRNEPKLCSTQRTLNGSTKTIKNITIKAHTSNITLHLIPLHNIYH